MSSYLVLLLLLLLIFLFCLVMIKRFWIEKKPISFGSQFVGENIYRQFLMADKKRAIEQVIYQREEKEQEAEDGEEVD